MSAAGNQAATTGVAGTAPAWALGLRKLSDALLYDLFGGPRPWKFAWIINLQKGGTFFLLGMLMWYYADKTPSATAPAAWVYLAMHGSYGLAWLIKDLAFPDANWQRRITIAGGLCGFSVLVLYWSFGWLLISGRSQPDYPLPDAAWFCLCISLCMVGSVIMVAADAQKHFTLRLRRGLITDGMFRYVRHPNYLGEMMLYGAFAMMVWHWFPVVVLASIWLGLFAPNMVLKEASMSRHAEWAAYKRRSWWLIPYVF